MNTIGILAMLVGGIATVGVARWWLDARNRRRSMRAFGEPSLDDTPLDIVSAWYVQRREESRAVESVDDRTWRDLEMDGVFRALDHCRTPLGRQQLVETLRAVPHTEARARRGTLADAIGASPALQRELATMLDAHRGFGGYALWRLMRAESLGGPLLRLAPIMTCVSVLLLVLAPFQPLALVLFVPLTALGLWLRMYATGTVISFVGPFRELSPVLRVARRLATIADPAIAPYAGQLRQDLTALGSLELVSRWVSREVMSSNALLGGLYEYVNLVLMLDANALLAASRALRKHRETLERVFETVGQVDVALAVASVRSTWPTWCRPSREPVPGGSPSIRFASVSHPQLPHGVANDVQLVAGRGLLLTGANMSGKSTLLRILGVNVILGATIDSCTAQHAHLTVDRVYTCIAHTDDFGAGQSLFFSEADVVVRLLRVAESRVSALFLFDELFRGTNAAERVAAAEAVMRQMVGGGVDPAATLVALATHDLELTRVLADCFDTWHLEVTMSDGHMDFRYRLQPGPARMRTALALLERLGAPSALLAAAAARASELDARADGVTSR